MKRFMLVCMVIALSAVQAAAVQKTVTVEWSYPAATSTLAGFRFYKDGALVSSTSNPAVRTHTMTLEIPSTTLSLTMRAYFSDGSEGPQSAVKTVFTPTPKNLRTVTTP